MTEKTTMSLTVTEDAKKLIIDLTKPLQSLFKKMGRNVSDRELAIEIELRFGEQIVREICIPLKVNQGAGLHVAMSVAKGL